MIGLDTTIRREQLVAAFGAGLAGKINLVPALDLLLRATGGNAVGMWRRVGSELRVMGFRCAAEFPSDVARDFETATQIVSLEQTGLGIVHATLTKEPAVALLPALGGRLPGSGGWLERFGSQQSLSMPLLTAQDVTGVLALSTRFCFERQDRTWIVMSDLAPELAKLIPTI